jgi:tetratricopeptide (TPR) repeat protein
MVADPTAEETLSHDGYMTHQLAAFQIPLFPLMGREAAGAQLLEALGLTWSSTDAWADAQQQDRFRARGSAGEVGTIHDFSAESWSWIVKLAYVLCTTWREVPPAEVIAALPSPEQLESYVQYTHTNRNYFTSLFLLAAQVCEKLEQPNDALLYAAKVLRYDPTKGSKDCRERSDDCRPTTHAQANALRGRVLASLGKKDQAEAAFEEAVTISDKHGLWLLEMFALRDLHQCILDGSGRGDEGVRRLKAVMQKMKGPPAELTKLLGGGLDAEEILRS